MPRLHHSLRHRAERLVNHLDPGTSPRVWLHAGAWLFIAASLLALGWIAAAGGEGHVFGAHAGGVTHTAWGLTYHGTAGSILLWTQIILVTLAVLGTLLPIRKARRLGHMVLIVWAGMWTIGAWKLALVQPFSWGITAGVVTVLFGCTLSRAFIGRRATPRWNDHVPAHDTPEPPRDEAPDATPKRDVSKQIEAWVHQGAATVKDLARRAQPTVRATGQRIAHASRAGYTAVRDSLRAPAANNS